MNIPHMNCLCLDKNNTSINSIIDGLCYDFMIDIPTKEVDYYCKHLTSMYNPMRMMMIRSFIEKYIRLPAINNLSNRELMYFIILLKKILLRMDFTILPYIISGNNEESDYVQPTILHEITADDVVLSLMSYTFTHVMYSAPEATGLKVVYDNNDLKLEVERFFTFLMGPQVYNNGGNQDNGK